MNKKIIFLIFSLIFSQIVNYYVNKRGIEYNQEQLRDPLIDNLPFFKGLDKIYDLLSLPPVFLTIINFDQYPNDNIFLNLGWIYFLRSLCILVTSIPKLKSCKIDYQDPQILFSGGCYDKIFSGHIAFVITFILYLISYSEQSEYKIIYIIYIIVGSLLSLITESHYSIDILISWIVSLTLFLTINRNISIENLIKLN